MRRDLQLEAFFLLCTVTCLTSGSTEVKGQAPLPCHLESLAEKSRSCLEQELRELRDSVDENRHLIDSIEKRDENVAALKGGQQEFPDADLHTRATASPGRVDASTLTDVRRYGTTTLRTVDVEEPVMEDADDEEAEDSEQSGDSSVPHKRSGGEDEDYDDDDDDDEDDEDEEDDDDDDEDDDDEIVKRKKKDGRVVNTTEKQESRSSMSSTEETSTGSTVWSSETSTPETSSNGVETTSPSAVRETKRDALLSRLDAFLGRDKKSGLGPAREADFEGVGKLKQIREIDKKVDQKLKEKYINAVEPRADEELLELMVKIAENPRDWHAVHSMLRQLDEDIAVVKQLEDEAKNAGETKRGENGVETKHKARAKLTKEQRKHQQADKKKKKKKKQRQKEKFEREEKVRQAAAATSSSLSDEQNLRRLQLERAGLLSAAAKARPIMKDQARPGKPTTSTKIVAPTTTTTPTPLATTSLPTEPPGGSKLLPHGAASQMEALDLAIDALSKDISGQGVSSPKVTGARMDSSPKVKVTGSRVDSSPKDTGGARIVLNPAQWPKPKSPMQEVREKWPKVTSLDRPISTGKAIVTGRLRPSADDDFVTLKTTSAGNEWSKTNIGAGAGAGATAEDKERARARFLGETVFAKNNVVQWKPNARAKWLETSPLPSKEHRASSRNNYFNGEPSRKQADNGWPDLSINSLKHGSIGKANEAAAMAGQDGWPDLPGDWPEFPGNAVDDAVWPGKLPAMPNNWPGISHSKAMEHAKEVASSKAWPHFAYHRVTSSPLQSRQRQQQEAQQRARHRSAYIAVSVIAPPENRTRAQAAAHAAHAANADNADKGTANKAAVAVANETRPLADKMDALLEPAAARTAPAHKLTPVDPLEEQLIDMAATGARNDAFNWSHARHLDKIQEQLKTLGAMEARLQAQWLEKERLRQILRDGGKSGAYYRDARSRLPVAASAASAAGSAFDAKNSGAAT